MNEAKGAIALVTGGGTGIGKAISTALSNAGYTLIIAGRRLELLQDTASEISAGSGNRVAAIHCDVGSAGSVAALFDEIRSNFGRLDLLVNNAGMGAPPIPLDEITPAQWDDVVAANLTGTFFCTQQAFRLMKEQQPRGGRIINNGSISATTPRPNSAPYTATKHAITGLTKSTALDGRPFDIACGQIDIGNAVTDMTAKMASGVLQADGTTAMEPTFPVNEVGEAVLHMASLPLTTNVLFMTIMATGMPFVGRG